jgi:hypothetical protein
VKIYTIDIFEGKFLTEDYIGEDGSGKALKIRINFKKHEIKME